MARYEGDHLGDGRLRPYLWVTIEEGGGSLKVPALVDSGADISLCPANLLAPLGVEFDTLDVAAGESRGAGGPFEHRRCSGKIWWREWELVGFDVSKADGFCILLGRDDFFKHFVVTFDWTTGKPWMDIEPKK